MKSDGKGMSRRATLWVSCARRKPEEALSKRSPFGESLAGRREQTAEFMLLSFGVEIRSCDRLEVGCSSTFIGKLNTPQLEIDLNW